MSDMMASYWGNFLMSDSGDPNEHKVGMKFLPKWPQFNGDSSTGKILSIDEVDSSNAVQGLKKDECAYWIPFVDASIRSTTW